MNMRMTRVLRVSVFCKNFSEILVRLTATHSCCLVLSQSAMGGPDGLVPVDV